MKLIKKYLFLIIAFLLLLTSCKKKLDIKLDNWYNLELGETLFSIDADDVVENCGYPYRMLISIQKPKEDINEVIKSCSYYLGEYQKEEKNGYLLFFNNNYYFSYANNENLIIENLVLEIGCQPGSCYIPFPIQSIDFVNSKQDLLNLLDAVSFNELYDFYSKFDQYVQIDKEKQLFKFETKVLYKMGKEINVVLNYKEKYMSIVEQEERILFQ